jgi:GDP-L-fucose synthase
MEYQVMPNVFITGSNGFVASNFIDYIRSNPEDFKDYSLIFTYIGSKPDVADIGRAVKCDLYKLGSIEKMFARHSTDPDNSIIIHLASVVGGINFHIEHPADVYYGINRMDGNIVEAAKNAEIGNFLYAGSACGYPPECYDSEGRIYEEMFNTGDPEDTVIGYGSAKKEMLTRLRTYGKQYGLQSCYPIITNMFGKYDNFDEITGHVIPALINKISCNPKTIVVRGNGEPIRDFLPASHAVRYLWYLARNNMSINPFPVNVGHGYGIAVKEILHIIMDHLKWDGDVLYDASKTDGTMKRILDVSLLREIAPSILGINGQENYKNMITEGIIETIDWYKNEKN